MKKLFLTSGLVLCMAGQAYADNITYDNNNSQYGSSACTYPYLDTYDVDSSLEAMWDPNPYTISLNSHTGANEYGSTASSPTDLYAVFGDAVYLEQAHTNAMSTSANGLTTNPGGKTYTLTLNPNLPGSHQVSEISGSTGYAASTNATMTFAGFFSATQSSKSQTNGTKYISGASDTNPGKITSDGISAGTGTVGNSTWHAQYTCTNADTYTPVLAGYTFNGWYDAATNGNVVNDFCLGSNKTVWAHWTANSCTVTYNPTSHSTNPSATAVTNTATYDAPYSVPTTAGRGGAGTLSAPATGYSFVGWTTDTEANMTVTRSTTTTGTVSNAWTWTDTNNWTSTTCPTLYAAYIANQYTVTYNYGAHAKAGSTDLANYTDTTLATYGSTYTVLGYSTTPISAHMQAADGYTFRGWSLDSSPTVTESGGVYSVSSPFTTGTWTRTANTTVYAAYSANSYTITYNCGGPKSGSASVVNAAVTGVVAAGSVPTQQTIAMGGSYTLQANTCTLAGYGFAGWDCKTAGSVALTGTPTVSYTDYDGTTQSTIFASGATGTFTNAANITCTAKWTQNQIGLTWNANGGVDQDGTSAYAPGSGTDSCNYDGGITLPAVPRRDGYTFTGWTVSNN